MRPPSATSLMVTPVVFSSTSLMVARFWSSMRLRVTTVTDCGMSLSACSVLPMVAALAAYDCEPSVWTL